jgi:IS30 family transposase
MEQYNHTMDSRKNKHLNAFERGQIQLLLKDGVSVYAIAKRLARAYNTIRNEIRHGTVTQIKGKNKVEIYYPDTAQNRYEEARRNCGNKYKLLACEAFIGHVEQLFHGKGFSLDSIVGVAKLNGEFPANQMVCTKTLYNYVDAGLLNILNIDLPLKLKRSTKPARVRNNKKRLGRSISERPESINDRSEFGHWEIDTVIGRKTKDDEALLTLTERLTRKEIIRKISGKNSAAVMRALNTLITEAGPHFSTVFKSITSDNGSEFSELSTLEPKTIIYFTHPYTSSERGTNERHNGLIRRFIPKGKRMSDYSVKFVAKIQTWCNSLPRKILGYLSPDEAFDDQLMNCIY